MWNFGFHKVQPSSMAVEWVFSVLKSHYKRCQNSSLQDLETSVMLGIFFCDAQACHYALLCFSQSFYAQNYSSIMC